MPVALLIFAVLIGLDQWLKVWSLGHLQTDTYTPVIQNVLSLILTFNTGAAWNLFAGATVFLAVLRVGVGIGLLFYLSKQKPQGITFWSLLLIAVGAVGNAIDVFWYGKVIDMFYSHQLSWVTQRIYGQPFPIFNLADICIVSGTILLMASSLFARKPEAPRNTLEA
ncbi:signal peptidase II [Deinococcus cellulosilyticus]|uniref:Lipoprotein signal peptidase n=1 Tax=Deinococcus cellulosilyticus (strain DSM 18568 / NBRC 106333 / KACC 11606 / 5516J-15) TaxID=1223518 RepID=A0A511N5W5_DEIC1|nr:signal peptidase II [Deinococcus cellulosilyticus]GEM47826.1 lipoprotein signal peptidase [Deinococcus cellulosilyticus NBRC 106333 = KACC 11606]